MTRKHDPTLLKARYWIPGDVYRREQQTIEPITMFAPVVIPNDKYYCPQYRADRTPSILTQLWKAGVPHMVERFASDGDSPSIIVSLGLDQDYLVLHLDQHQRPMVQVYVEDNRIIHEVNSAMELKRFCEKTLIFFQKYGTIQEITSILFKPRNPTEKESDERPGHLSEGPPEGGGGHHLQEVQDRSRGRESC